MDEELLLRAIPSLPQHKSEGKAVDNQGYTMPVLEFPFRTLEPSRTFIGAVRGTWVSSI